jgi:hypothetical protein
MHWLDELSLYACFVHVQAQTHASCMCKRIRMLHACAIADACFMCKCRRMLHACASASFAAHLSSNSCVSPGTAGGRNATPVKCSTCKPAQQTVSCVTETTKGQHSNSGMLPKRSPASAGESGGQLAISNPHPRGTLSTHMLSAFKHHRKTTQHRTAPSLPHIRTKKPPSVYLEICQSSNSSRELQCSSSSQIR